MRSSRALLAAVVGLVGSGVAFAGVPISIHLASLDPVDGFVQRTVGDETIFVSPRVALSEAALLAAESSASSDVAISLSEPGVRHLQRLLRRSDVDHMAVFTDGRLMGAGQFVFDTTTAELTISGLNPSDIGDLTDAVRAAATGGMISLVPSTTHVLPGGLVDVDVFVSGIASLRTFQVALTDPMGGLAGRFTLEDIQIDLTRSDFVFGARQNIAVPDFSGNRIGGVLFSDGVNAMDDLYLGTFTYRASRDAEGKFRLTVNGGDRRSLLWTSQNEPTAFRVNAAAITIGTPVKSTTTR